MNTAAAVANDRWTHAKYIEFQPYTHQQISHKKLKLGSTNLLGDSVKFI